MARRIDGSARQRRLTRCIPQSWQRSSGLRRLPICMRPLVWASLLGVAVTGVTTPARAAPQELGVQPNPDDWIVEVSLRGGVESDDLGASQFSGSGTSASGAPEQVQASGADLGFGHMTSAMLGADVLAHLGAHVAIGGELASPMVSPALDGTQTHNGLTFGTVLHGLSVGPIVAAVFQLGAFQIRPEALIGYQYFWVSIYGFQPSTCKSLPGDPPYTCFPSMATGALVVQPRLTVSLRLATVWGAGLVAGAYAGGDLLPQRELGGGLFAGFRY
jgi:hypothetical protein